MRDPVAVLRALEASPTSFNFFAALRQLECAFPDKPRIGTSQRPSDDACRFGQQPSMAFEASMIANLAAGYEDGPPHLRVHFFGMLGANGPLPLHFTEYAQERLRDAGDKTLARFLDIFHHRMLSLFYRAWASAQPTASLDRPDADRFGEYVASLGGMGMPSLRNRDTVPDFARLHFVGRLAAQQRNAEGLAAILADFFGLPVKVEEFVGHWMALPGDNLCRLGRGFAAPLLGRSTVLGRRVWNRQHKFRVVIGPLDLVQFKRMLPGGCSLRRLIDWVRSYAGLACAWDVCLILQRASVPLLRLGSEARLGWTTWLSSMAFEHDDDQLRFSPTDHAR